jgi:hypothetical protein
VASHFLLFKVLHNLLITICNGKELVILGNCFWQARKFLKPLVSEMFQVVRNGSAVPGDCWWFPETSGAVS